MITDQRRYKSIKSMTGLAIIIITLSVLTIIVYTYIVNSMKSTYIDTSNQMKTEKFEQVYLYYQELNKQGYNLTKEVANNIESEIKETFNLDDLKEDLDKNGYNDDLISIFRSNIQGKCLNNISNHRNGISVISNDQIEEDYNYQRAFKSTKNNINDRSLQSEKKNNYNEFLFTESMDKIKTHSGDMIGLEYNDPEYEDHIKIKTMNKANLKRVYMEEGVDGLKNYQFLVPVYITNTGDIFGQSDIIKGKIQKNHKFIIVLEFNLYDQMCLNHGDLLNDSTMNAIQIRHQHTLILLHLIGIIFIVDMIVIIFGVVSVYNNFITGYMKAYKDGKHTDHS